MLDRRENTLTRFALWGSETSGPSTIGANPGFVGKPDGTQMTSWVL